MKNIFILNDITERVLYLSTSVQDEINESLYATLQCQVGHNQAIETELAEISKKIWQRKFKQY